MTITDEDTEMIGQAPAIKVKLNLDYASTLNSPSSSAVNMLTVAAEDFETSDYLKEGDAGFKKPRKKKVKRSARKAEDDEDDANGMEVDGQPVFVRREVANGPENLVDDDDLQAALSRARRENAKKKPKVKAEDLAAQSERVGCLSWLSSPLLTVIPVAQRKEEEQAAAAQETAADGDEDGRITFDDTSEFVRNVTLDSLQPVKRERAVSPAQPSTSTSAPNGQPVVVKIERGEDGEVEDGEDEDMSEDEDEGLAEMAAREGMSLEEYRLKIDSQMKEMSEMQAEDVEVSRIWGFRSSPPLGGDNCFPCCDSHSADPFLQKSSEPEPVVGQGMAGVLSLLRNQGALKKVSAEDQERERVQKQSDLWLADFRRRQAKRELERILARGGNKDQAQREWENKVREQQEARDALEVYRDYKPDINIVYHDEFGRSKCCSYPRSSFVQLSRYGPR
jgi:U4/U6.U5 tri-snRNP-associated protein 1